MKWYGTIGYAEMVQTEPGIYDEAITELEYYGDVVSNRIKIQSVSDKINSDVNVSNQISVVADPYAHQHVDKMRYITFNGVKWHVSDVEVQYPRLLVSLGGVWNENEN